MTESSRRAKGTTKPAAKKPAAKKAAARPGPRADKADEEAVVFKKLGCETRTGQHDGHYDIRYRCAKWRTVSQEDHDQVHVLQKWLKRRGFETRHSH